MSIRVDNKNWQNNEFREAILSVASLLQEEIIIEKPLKKFKPYNVQLWRDDDILEERDFLTKPQAKKWIKQRLSLKKNHGAYADLKKYNKSNDDFDWWFYKVTDNKLEEVDCL